ncbi:MAG: hypothetical protein ABIP61_14735 [Burkholderiaceae bacterium]
MLFILAPLFITVPIGQSLAQKLPSPSRTVFKCESGEKIVYSDSPCLGAQRLDIEPTRGVNMNPSGKLVGSDVRTEQQNEQVAEALKPIFGESARERAKRHARARLDPEARSACAELDRDIPAAEQQEKLTAKTTRPSIQARLLDMRSKYRELRC